MNFNAPDFLKDLESTKDKLDSEVDLEHIQSALNLPELSEFSKLAQGLLPQNLIKVDENGKLGLPSLTELQQSLYSGLTDIKDYLEKEITGAFNSVIGEAQAVFDEAKTVYDDLSNLATSINKDSSIVADKGLELLNSATGLNITSQSVGSLQKSISNSIESFTTLSPKKVKDLADPNFYGRMVNATLNNTLEVAGKAAELSGLEGLLNDQSDSSGYVNLFKSTMESSKNILPKEKESDPTQLKIPVKRTVYWGKGEGATPEAASKKANTGNKLVDDYSLLVDNKDIIIGCKVKFEDDKKEREAVDVATPSKGVTISKEYPTVAIYFDTKEKAQAYMKSYPNDVVNAIVTVPSQSDKDDKQKIKEKAKEKKEEVSKLEKPTKAELQARLDVLQKREAELLAEGVQP